MKAVSKIFCYGSNMEPYADRLRPLMDEQKMDKQALADALGVSYQSVRKVLELGGSFGSKNNLRAAELFNVNPTWLASGEGEKMDLKNPPDKAANDLPVYSPFADSLAYLFDKLPEDDQVLRSDVYARASDVIRTALGMLPNGQPTPAPASNPEKPDATPPKPKARHK
jgi:transcriptional regulator with XRE-family HTH domain